jgi:hypothetical protein
MHRLLVKRLAEIQNAENMVFALFHQNILYAREGVVRASCLTVDTTHINHTTPRKSGGFFWNCERLTNPLHWASGFLNELRAFSLLRDRLHRLVTLAMHTERFLPLWDCIWLEQNLGVTILPSDRGVWNYFLA